MQDITNRIDELNKKMDFNVYALKQVNSIFKQMKSGTTEEIKPNEVKYETFAGKPIKLAKSRH
jgi:hypothetical protein